MITTEFVAQYIDKIFVTITDADRAKLDIKIFTGKNTEKWFSRLNARSKGRTGHTLKKMIESYENSIKTGKYSNREAEPKRRSEKKSRRRCASSAREAALPPPFYVVAFLRLRRVFLG